MADVTAEMDAYDLSGACWAIGQYLDALTNWYVRRSRDRFWAGDGEAFDTLAAVLEVVCRVAAPLLPMIAEDIWTGLTGHDSVHLADWPQVDELPADDALVATMDRVREVCSAASSVRKAGGLRVRLPLASLTVAAPDAPSLQPFSSLMADEVNVRDVVLTEDVTSAGAWVLALVPAVLGPRVGADVQKLIRAVKAGSWERAVDGTVSVLDRTLADDEYTLKLVPRDESVARALDRGGIVALDVTPSPQLEAEGIARDVIRQVQQARKEAGLHVSDRIDLGLATSAGVFAAVDANRDRVVEAVLAVSLEVVEAAEELDPAWMSRWDHVATTDLDGEPLTIGLSRHPA